MTIILARSRVQFSYLQHPKMVSFTRIYYQVCCKRTQINQNTANSSQRSKHHSMLHQSCSRRHVGFRDMSTFGSFPYPFLSRCSEILFKVNWFVLSNFQQVQSIKLSHYFIAFFLLVLENWNIECLRLLSVPLTGLSLLIAAAGGVLYEVIFSQVLSPMQSLPTLFIRH